MPVSINHTEALIAIHPHGILDIANYPGYVHRNRMKVGGHVWTAPAVQEFSCRDDIGRVHPCVRPVRAAPHGCWPWWSPQVGSLITSSRSKRCDPLGFAAPRSDRFVITTQLLLRHPATGYYRAARM